MTTALDVVLIFLTLIVGVWIMVFGSLGTLLAPRADLGRFAGFTLGVLTGPAGIGWLLWRGRQAAQEPTATSEKIANELSVGDVTDLL